MRPGSPTKKKALTVVGWGRQGLGDRREPERHLGAELGSRTLVAHGYEPWSDEPTCPPRMVPTRGVEPRSLPYESSALPLDHVGSWE